MAIEISDAIPILDAVKYHWCPYTGADGAKAIQAVADYLKYLKNRYGGFKKFNKDEEVAAYEKRQLDALEKRAAFAQCKGPMCPKAQFVYGRETPMVKYIFCGGSWKD